MNKKFSIWSKWNERQGLSNLQHPGVYAIAISKLDISGKPFSWRPEIVYIGMTNSKKGLKSRLKQFDNTIKGKRGHGGAQRVKYKHCNYNKLVTNLFVSIHPFNCSVELASPSDLLIMGDVAKYEYTCLAKFAKAFDRLPEFNDKKKSPKK